MSDDVTNLALESGSRTNGRLSLAISLIALLFSWISLYETVLKTPHLRVNTASVWEYARGESAQAEQLYVPLSISNDGAREATVLSLELVLEKAGGPRKIFRSRYILREDTSAPMLMAPTAVPGKASHTSIVIFASDAGGAPAIDGVGQYTAHLSVRSTYAKSLGFIDELIATPPGRIEAALTLDDFSVATLIGSRKRLPISVVTMDENQ